MTDARMRPAQPDAVLFDLDGVLTDTAAVHMRAWASLFTDYLAERHPDVPPYRDQDYFDSIDGKSRVDGVRSMLASRSVELPDGGVDDAAGTDTLNALGNHKNELFTRILERDGVRTFSGSVRMVNALSARATPIAVVSSSRNALAVLEAADLGHRFALVVDGSVAANAGLAGKPAPDMFLYAASSLGVDPTHTVVFEDALSGVTAARAGGFWTVGVDRGIGADALRAAGADEVVGDVGDLLTAFVPTADDAQ